MRKYLQSIRAFDDREAAPTPPPPPLPELLETGFEVFKQPRIHLPEYEPGGHALVDTQIIELESRSRPLNVTKVPLSFAKNAPLISPRSHFGPNDNFIPDLSGEYKDTVVSTAKSVFKIGDSFQSVDKQSQISSPKYTPTLDGVYDWNTDIHSYSSNTDQCDHESISSINQRNHIHRWSRCGCRREPMENKMPLAQDSNVLSARYHETKLNMFGPVPKILSAFLKGDYSEQSPKTIPLEPGPSPGQNQLDQDKFITELAIDEENENEKRGQLKTVYLLVLLLILEQKGFGYYYSDICTSASLSQTTVTGENSGSRNGYRGTNSEIPPSSSIKGGKTRYSFKRKRVNQDESGDEDGPKRRPPQGALARAIAERRKHLACPFAKASPEYNPECLLIHRRNLAGIKEHVKRKHFNGVLPEPLFKARTWELVFSYCNSPWLGPIPDPYLEFGQPMKWVKRDREQTPELHRIYPRNESMYSLQSHSTCERSLSFQPILPQPPHSQTTESSSSIRELSCESSGFGSPQGVAPTTPVTPTSTIDFSPPKEPSIGQLMADISTEDWFASSLAIIAPESDFTSLGFNPVSEIDFAQLSDYMYTNFEVDINKTIAEALDSGSDSGRSTSDCRPCVERETNLEEDLRLNANNISSPPPSTDITDGLTSLDYLSYPQEVPQISTSLPKPITHSARLPKRKAVPAPAIPERGAAPPNAIPKRKAVPVPANPARTKKYTLQVRRGDSGIRLSSPTQRTPKKFQFDNMTEFKREFENWMIENFQDPAFSWHSCEFEDPQTSNRISDIDTLVSELEWTWIALRTENAALFLTSKRAMVSDG
ncbi:hypothetical protein H072_7133 [Dactylellina haptotyla CBS 200.50]|uniref:Uncharacterized protein n=1 Tax=Dactylellina haptotyla (strain CBS 200.50) TaxID=1284197 RepID=S8A7W6_DACHA|nr:hypothetical protein H072_7133 [Dactylellina haptotyla CBS 200.50]